RRPCEISVSIEPGRRAVHPVRAAVRTLPGGHLLLVGTDISQGRRFAEKFRFAALWGIGLSTLAAALAGFWFSYKLARRVGEVTRTCQRIMAGETGRRLPVAGANDEFDALAESVNRVLDRLEEQAVTLRATFDSTAHDLRAPLHRLRTRMDALLLRSPPPEPAVRESIASALRDVAQLLTNLIENGLKYVPAGGRIEVAVRPLSDCVQLTVSDNGPGIATQDRVRAVQPFVRFGPGAGQEGSGLGLSLVAAIARLHRGRLELQSNDPGLKVLVELPA